MIAEQIKQIIEVNEMPVGVWHIRVLVESNGSEKSHFFKMHQSERPDNEEIFAKALEALNAIENTPITLFPSEIPTLAPTDLVGLEDIPQNVIQRVWTAIINWLKVKFGRV